MKLSELIKETGWRRSGSMIDHEISELFTGDLLSYVMGHGRENQIWISMQNHINSIGVANLKEFAAILLIDGLEFDEESLKRAIENDVAIINSPESAVDSIRTLIKLGL